MSASYKRLGKKIKNFRKEKGMSQEQLAEKCDLSTSYISYIETGKRRINFSQLEKMAEILDFSIDINSNDNCIKYDFQKFNNFSYKERKFLYKVLLSVKSELDMY